MTDSDFEKEVEDGIREINSAIVTHVLNYLKTDVFTNKTAEAYILAYSIVYKLADDEHDSSSKLFQYYNEKITSFMTETCNMLHTESSDNLLEAFLKYTEKSKILIHWMRKVFSYLDKFYTINNKVGTLFENALKNYYNNLFLPLKPRLISALNTLINNHRDGKVVEIMKIVRVIKIFRQVDLKEPILNKVGDDFEWSGNQKKSHTGVLTDWFFNYFIKSTEQYVSNKAKVEISALSAPEYVKSCLKYLKEEEDRKNFFISKEFYQALDSVNNKHLIENNCKILAGMESGISNMFKNKKISELREVYDLFCRNVDTFKTITEIMSPYIKDRGEIIYNNKDLARDPTKFIPELIKLKQEIDDLVENSFNNNIVFQDCKNKSFSHLMSKEHYSKQLANYCDFEFKVGLKGANDNQIEEKMNNIINLFKCLNNKMIFQFEYSKKLSDRLLSGKTQSMFAENLLISRLKAEQGVTFVSKMTSMMQDLDSSRNTMDAYKLLLHRGYPAQGVQLNCQILQNGAWEIDKVKFEKYNLPKILKSCLDDFESFYLSRQKTHKLMWVYELGNMDIKLAYLKRAYQSTSTAIQYCILLHLEKSDQTNTQLTIEELTGKLAFNPSLIINEISGLIFNMTFNPKKELNMGLISTDLEKEADLNLKTKVWLNKDFQFSNLKISTIPQVVKKPASQEDEQNKMDAQNLKNYQNIIVDSNLTRIMKGRIGQKTTHIFLINEVAKQIELFQAQPALIKERIEALIEKEIIKRDDNDRNCYVYVS